MVNTLNSVNHDGLVRTTLRDGSVENPSPEATPVGISYLQPFFSKKGIDNVITRVNGVGSFETKFGNDIDNVKKYGHGGLIASRILAAGGIIDGCRLMPEAATKASSVLCVTISAEKDVDASSGTALGRVISLTTKTFNFTNSVAQNLAATTTGGVTTYPLFALIAKGRGSYGNEYGFKLKLDTERDGRRTNDGRRYVLELTEITNTGSIKKLGSNFEFISASLNPLAVTVPGTATPDSIEAVFDAFTKSYDLPLDFHYSSENYDAIIEVLSAYKEATTDEDNMIDFISGKDVKTGAAYTKIKIDTTTSGTIDTTSVITYLTGGDDADLFDLTSTTVGSETNTAAYFARKDLLLKFYGGEIDPNIFDQRIVDSGITLDAFFPLAVKEYMAAGFGEEIRSDISVILDAGEDSYSFEDATTIFDGITIGNHYGNVAMNVHNGKTLDRQKNIRTSGNYDIAAALPTLYRQRGMFTTLAGFIVGTVRYMDFDDYPRVVKDDLELKPLRDKNLLFATKLLRNARPCYMSDSSKYATEYSVFGSLRNFILTGEVIRTFNKVLAKYAFDPGKAPGAITDANSELASTFSNTSYFPADTKIAFTIFQTRNDKLNKTATVDASITFPDVIESFKVTLTGYRQPTE